MPKGARLKEVSVDAPWDIDLAANLSAEKLSVKTSYGEIKMEDWNGIDLSIYDEDGDIKTGNLTGNKVEITGLYGDLNIGCIESTQASLEAENGSVTVFAGTQGTLDVKNSYGDTNIYEMQKAECIWDMISTQNMVKIAFLRDIEMMKMERRRSRVQKNRHPASAVIRVSAENGDIKIRENVARSTLEETVAETKSVDEEE